jgi:hypothetical protein
MRYFFENIGKQDRLHEHEAAVDHVGFVALGQVLGVPDASLFAHWLAASNNELMTFWTRPEFGLPQTALGR